MSGYCAADARRPAVLGLLMDLKVHCGPSAPAATNRQPLATPAKQFLVIKVN